LKIIAHRTTSGVYPPNSIESLLFLAERGIRAVEVDICKSNGKIVAAHPGLVKEAALAASSLFADFLKVCKSMDIEVFVDIKFTDFKLNHLFLKSVGEIISDIGMVKQSVVISRAGSVLSQYRGKIAIGYITTKINPEFLQFYDALLVPLENFRDSVIPLKWRKKIVATGVDTSNVELLRKFNLCAIMTEYPIEIQTLLMPRARSKTNFGNKLKS
jgi:glycerophosphoryl diester phosphodiesterase